ncbi:MAG TPA: hypothetical protein VHS03_01525, partial [Gaiellaceae bacterium]|nr:hypothetical protein [Gaiellaceae bacterium]
MPIDTAVLIGGLAPGDVVDAFPAETVDLEPPLHAAERFARIPGWYPSPRWRLHHELGAARVLTIPGGIVFGHEGWVGPDEQHAVTTWNAFVRADRHVARVGADALERGVAEVPGTSASLLQLGWGNYYHWLLQGLPRLHAMITALGAEHIDRFLVGGPRPFVDETLERLGIGEDRL